MEFFNKILQSLRNEIPLSLAISGSNEFFVSAKNGQRIQEIFKTITGFGSRVHPQS